MQLLSFSSSPIFIHLNIGDEIPIIINNLSLKHNGEKLLTGYFALSLL
ncbi:hypothetical protein AC82_4832 [Escherichia coli 1-182-04_S4_C1]|nr:hypothetical protein AC82_4832 [Escherichia coli 1-182-04_S4_C1]